MESKKELRFEKPEKPEIENLKNISVDCSDFSEPEKAEALIKSLNLSVNDTIKEEDGERFIINPRIILKGDSEGKYKREVEEAKKILTKNEIKSISLYYRRKKEDSKIRDKIYYGITKRVDKLYKWDDKNKIHKPIKEKYKEICYSLDWINQNNYLSGFNNLIYHLLNKSERGSWIYSYKCAWFNKQIPNTQEWNEENDGEYWVLTERDADYKANEYLTDDDYLWKEAVESGNTTDGLEEWAEYVISMDGRGSVLNGYDGTEETETINGIEYCIYRIN